MLKSFAAAAFAALVAAAPLPALAQTSAPGAQSHHAQRPTGSYRSQMRHRHGDVHRRARAGAEHARQTRAQ